MKHNFAEPTTLRHLKDLPNAALQDFTAVDRDSMTIALFRLHSANSQTCCGIICAVISGILPLSFTWTLGKILDTLSATQLSVNDIDQYCGLSLLIGICCIATSTMCNYCFGVASEAIINDLRIRLLSMFTRQNLDWHEAHPDFAAALTLSLPKIEAAISFKMANLIESLCCFTCALVLSFVRGWRLTLVMLAAAPLLLISGGVLSSRIENITSATLSNLSRLGEISVEYFSNMRLVKMLSLQKFVFSKISFQLHQNSTSGIHRGLLVGLLGGMVELSIACSYSLGMWYGAKVIASDPTVTGGDIIIIFNSLIWGFCALGQALACLTVFESATSSLDAVDTLFATAQVEVASDNSRPRTDSATLQLAFYSI